MTYAAYQPNSARAPLPKPFNANTNTNVKEKARKFENTMNKVKEIKTRLVQTDEKINIVD